MEFRNAQHNGQGGIDCEINHPKFGWIPFTASPNDAEQHGRDVFAAAEAEAAPYVPPPEPTPEQIQAQITAAINAHVEAQARALKYNGAAHLASYVTSGVPEWQAEAQAFVAWRDAVWTAALEMLADAEASGDAPSEAEAIAALPEWGSHV